MPRNTNISKPYSEFGARLRRSRMGLGWSQLDLSMRAEISSSYLAELERGGRNPSLETIFSLAAAMDISAGFLVDGYRFEAPAGLGPLADIWPSLQESSRSALIHLAWLLSPEGVQAEREKIFKEQGKKSGRKSGRK